MFIAGLYFLASIVMVFYAEILFTTYDYNRNYEPMLYFDDIKYKWDRRNNFGKFQMIVIGLVFLPSFFFGFLLAIVEVFGTKIIKYIVRSGLK